MMIRKILNLLNALAFSLGLLLPGLSAAAQDTPVQYRKPLFEFNEAQPAFALDAEQKRNSNRFLRSYLLSGYREGVMPVAGLLGRNFKAFQDTVSGTNRVYMLNLSIEELLTHGNFNKASVILEVKDPSKYRYDAAYGPELEWKRKNAYCFELTYPIGAVDNFITIDELLRSLFNVRVSSEIRKVKTLVLKRSSGMDKMKAIGGGALVDEVNGRFQNVNLSTLAGVIGTYWDFPVVDETRYAGAVSLNLDIKDWKDLGALRKALSRYDLELAEELREWQMEVIRENDFK